MAADRVTLTTCDGCGQPVLNGTGHVGHCDPASETDVDYIRADLAERLRAENEILRQAFGDEAYILMVQALEVKALGKGRRRILTEQALRMARVCLGEDYPRHVTYLSARIPELAREVIRQLSPAFDEDQDGGDS